MPIKFSEITEETLLTDEEWESFRYEDGGLCSNCVAWKEDKCNRTKSGEKLARFGQCDKFHHKEVDGNPYFAGHYSDFELWFINPDKYSDEPNYNKLAIRCPICKKEHYPFRNKIKPAFAYNSRTFTGDIEEPCTFYIAVCPTTKRKYILSVVYDQ